MRITFDAAPVETLEYLKTITMVLRNNKDESTKAFRALKELEESLAIRIGKLENSERRNKVCR